MQGPPRYTHAARAALLVLHGQVDHQEGEVRGGVWQHRTQQLLLPETMQVLELKE